MKRFLFLMTAAVIVLGAETLTVASAKGYKKPMVKLFERFKAQNGIAVTPIFGNMRQVISQTQLSGKVSVIVGDRAFLERSSLDIASYIPLGNGKLVLAYPKGGSLESIEQITGEKVRKIAMPDPKKAIYGKAAAQFLRDSGLQEKVGGKLLTVGTVPQVSAYLIAGEIDAGFINLTDALGIKERIGGYIEADRKLYTPIEIVCGIVAGHEGDRDVLAFAEFLKTAQARAIIEKFGL
jgi:molybdate transport system substrate-binding protein